MNEIVTYLKACGAFYLATVDNEQPRVRPFGAVCEFEGKLYITTANNKKVYQQMIANNHVEICGMNNDTWIRVEGEVVEDMRREARVAMMDANPTLSSMYNVDDNIFTVLYFSHGTATIYSYTEEPKVYTF